MEMEHRYCARCGKAAHPLVSRRLERDVYNKQIAGVCSGIAKWLGWDATVVRLVWLGVAIFLGVGFLAYPICWLVMPRNDIRVPAGLPAASFAP